MNRVTDANRLSQVASRAIALILSTGRLLPESHAGVAFMEAGVIETWRGVRSAPKCTYAGSDAKSIQNALKRDASAPRFAAESGQP